VRQFPALAARNLGVEKSSIKKAIVNVACPAPEPSSRDPRGRIPFVEAPRRSSAPQSFAANTISAGGFLRSLSQSYAAGEKQPIAI